MTQDEIIEMARQAGFEIGEIEHSESIFNPYTDDEWRINKELEAFAKLVAAKEREACATICECFQARDVGMQPAECAGAIRARGET